MEVRRDKLPLGNPIISPEGEWTVQMQLALQVHMRPRDRSAINSYPSLQSLGPPMPDLAYTWALNLCTYAATCHLAPTRNRNRTVGGPAPTTHYYWRPIPPDMDLRQLYPYRGEFYPLLPHRSRWIYTAASALISLLLLRDNF